jgi:hypothetical protein
MLLNEFSNTQVFLGTDLSEENLSKQPQEFVYLTKGNITEGRIDANTSKTYISDKNIRKYYSNKNITPLNYGDYLLFKLKDEVHFIRYQNELNKPTIISNDFITIKIDGSFFQNAITDREGRKYFIEQASSLYRKYDKDGDLQKLLEDIRKIKINEQVDLDRPDAPTNRLQKLNPAEIDIRRDRIIVLQLLKRIEGERINMFTHFQRAGNLWTTRVKSRFIESLLISFPVPSFYFDATNDSKWAIIDGLQRLSALQDFYLKDMKLKDLEYLTDLNGLTYNELDIEYQDKIMETNVDIIKIEKKTPKRVKYSLFQRLNTSGLVLKPQEIRHAAGSMDDAKPANFVKELSESPLFKTIWGGRANNRMQDREMVLRHIAFILTPPDDYDYSDLKPFLDDAMEKLFEVTVFRMKDIEESFDRSLETCIYIFDTPFIIENAKKAKVFSAILFETLTVLFAKLSKDEIFLLRKNKDKLNTELNKLIKTDEWETEVAEDNETDSNTDFSTNIEQELNAQKGYARDSVRTRFNIIENLIKNVIKS